MATIKGEAMQSWIDNATKQQNKKRPIKQGDE